MRARVAAVLAAVLAAAWVACAGVASAQSHGGGDDYARAAQLRRERQPEQALALYEQLATRTGDARALGERGITEAQMGRWVAAEEHLVAALADEDRWIRHHRSALQGALEAVRTHLADLVVACNVRGAALRVNGAVCGALPRTTAVRVPLGPVVLDVTAEHFEAHRETLQVTERSHRVEVTLVPEAAAVAVAPVVAPAVAPVATVAARVPVPVVATTTPVPSAPSSGALPALRIASFSLAAAGIALGITGYVLSSAAVDSYSAASCQYMNGTPSTECQGFANSFHATQAMETGAFVAAGVFAVGGAVLLFVHPSRTATHASAWSCGQGPGSYGVSCGARF